MQRTKRAIAFLLAEAIACLIGLLLFGPAHATILFAGGEDVDFVLTGAVTINTSCAATQCRSAYVRESLWGAISSTDPPDKLIQLPATFANQTSIWIHANAVNTTGNGTMSGGQYIGIYGSDGVRRLLVRGTGTSGQVKLSKATTARSFTDLATCTLGAWPGTSGPLIVDLFLNDAVSGTFTMYVNGVQICTFSGDTTTDGVSQVNRVDFASGGTPSTAQTNWSEVIVSTTDTRSMNLFTCAPQANGTNMNWTGSFTNVNGTTANDANPLVAASNNLVAEFTCPSLPAGSFSVPAVVQVGRLLKGASGPANFRFIMRPGTGSTDFDSGSDIPLTTNFSNYRFIWSTNPACSCAWLQADVAGTVNQGVISKP